MNRNSSNESSKQSIQAGRDAIQVGRDYTSTKTTNYFFTFFMIGILALGGLAWGLYTGVIQNPAITNPSQPSTSPASTK